jgi:hypothetical protein
MKGEALRTMRTAVAALIALSAVWGLAYSSVVDDLLRRERAAHLTAWLALKERFAEFDFDTNEQHGVVKEEMIEGTVGPGIDVSRTEPLSVWTVWPQERMNVFRLLRAKPDSFGARVYDVLSDPGLFPFSAYQVVVPKPGEIAIVQREDWKTLRHLHDAIYGSFNQRAVPYRWRETRVALLGLGMDDTKAAQLRTTNHAVAQFLNNAISRERSALGVNVDSGLFFAGVGLAMLAIVGPLAGPVIALARTRSTRIESEWYLALPAKRRHGLLELGAVLSSVVVIAIPGAVTWLLWRPRVTLLPAEVALRIASTASLILCMIVLALAFRELRRIRLSGVDQTT